jgi:hypothetical protein
VRAALSDAVAAASTIANETYVGRTPATARRRTPSERPTLSYGTPAIPRERSLAVRDSRALAYALLQFL